MKTKACSVGILLIACVAAIACVTYTGGYREVPMGQPAVANVPAAGSDQPFYDDLAAYGRWVYTDGPGWVWSPYNVQAGWRPYTLGHWVLTDYGWTWASDEEWGSIVYHYGRWNQDPRYGWVWVPGTEWGPAWVAWQEGGGYVGWAPLPSQVTFRAGFGLDWGGVNLTIRPASWCFVNARFLVDPGLRSQIMAPARNVTLIRITKNITNYTFVENRIVNEGVRTEAIGRAVGHDIPRYRLAEAATREETRGGKVRGQEFVVYRPDPGRGRGSQGHVPPGQIDRERPGEGRGRDFRGRDLRPFQSQPPQTPPAAEPNPPGQTATQTAPQSAPPSGPQSAPQSTAGGPDQPQDRGRDMRESRGRKFLDNLIGRQPAAGTPQAASAGQPPAQGQPSAQGQPAAQGQSSAQGQSAAPGQSTAPGPSAAPGHGAPADKAQADRGRGHGPNKPNPVKPGKPKPDAEKGQGHEGDKPNTDKPDSGH